MSGELSDVSANFSKETIQFLVENRMRDDRAWFDEHRKEYRELVVEPFAALVTALEPAMREIDEQLVLSPKVGGSISRIWRDTRFSKDKLLFRDHMWISLLRQKGQMLPEFFFVITPDSFLYGAGYYAANAESMVSFRGLILENSKEFQAARVMFEQQNRFVLEGDKYKRSRYPDQPELLRDFLDRKVISLMRTSDDWDLLFSDRLPDVLATDFKLIAPMYRLFIRAEDRVRKDNI